MTDTCQESHNICFASECHENRNASKGHQTSSDSEWGRAISDLFAVIRVHGERERSEKHYSDEEEKDGSDIRRDIEQLCGPASSNSPVKHPSSKGLQLPKNRWALRRTLCALCQILLQTSGDIDQRQQSDDCTTVSTKSSRSIGFKRGISNVRHWGSRNHEVSSIAFECCFNANDTPIWQKGGFIMRSYLSRNSKSPNGRIQTDRPKIWRLGKHFGRRRKLCTNHQP
jgi:hypothetical protein